LRLFSERKESKSDPRVLFKIMIYGYQCDIYSSRKLEEACRYRIEFKWLLEEQPVPDHATLARFRTGRCAQAAEELFYQYARRLEDQRETDHETVFIDGTKLESRAGGYTFRWRKPVEKQLASFLSMESVSGKAGHSGSGRRRTGGAGTGKVMSGICPSWEAAATAIPPPIRTPPSCA